MILARFFNSLSELFEDRMPLDASAVAYLDKAGHLKIEHTLEPRQFITLADLAHAGEVGRHHLSDGRAAYYDRFVADNYQVARLIPQCDTFWNTVFTPRRDLSEILQSIPAAPLVNVLAPPLVPQPARLRVVS